MTKNVITIDLKKSISDAALLMKERTIGSLVVTDGETPVGIVTERDFVRRAVANKLQFDNSILEIMSKPLVTIDPNFSLEEAARLMLENKIRRLLVLEEGKIKGIIVASDFARQLSEETLSEKILKAIARYPIITTDL
ncbi:MAG: CBS domain-containing protein [Candidatus Bathyarchaeota archaeon]|nr:MAG: CBS domain-containing protein [Candidatus Bathyarchaeota archaeon]